MNRKTYLWLIVLITIACIIGGSIWHGHRAPRHHQIEQEIREELREDLEDELEESFEEEDDLDTDRDDADIDSEITDRDDADEDIDDTDNDADDLAKYNMIPLEGTQADGKNIPFTNIDMTLGAFDIFVTNGQDYGVTYYVSQDEYKPTAEIKDGTLYISQESIINNVNSFEDLVKWLSSRTGVTAKMLITVPEGSDIGNLTFKNGAGDTDIKNVTIDTLTAESSAGDLDLENVTVNTLDADSSAGNVDVNNSTIGSAIFDSSAGNVDLENTTIDKATFENSAGDIELTKCTVKDLYASVSAGNFEMSGTPNLADYNISLDASAGDIRIGENKIEGTYVQSGKDGLKITVESSAGDITIK